MASDYVMDEMKKIAIENAIDMALDLGILKADVVDSWSDEKKEHWYDLQMQLSESLEKPY